MGTIGGSAQSMFFAVSRVSRLNGDKQIEPQWHDKE
jgi:hypothetical protein